MIGKTVKMECTAVIAVVEWDDEIATKDESNESLSTNTEVRRNKVRILLSQNETVDSILSQIVQRLGAIVPSMQGEDALHRDNECLEILDPRDQNYQNLFRVYIQPISQPYGTLLLQKRIFSAWPPLGEMWVPGSTLDTSPFPIPGILPMWFPHRSRAIISG